MSYAAENRMTTHTRAKEWDLGLSPREEIRIASDFSTGLRALLRGEDVKDCCWPRSATPPASAPAWAMRIGT